MAWRLWAEPPFSDAGLEKETDMAKEKRVRVLMAKPGVDGHYRGIFLVSTVLRSAGFEVIYGGNMSPPEIASAAAQEDVDVVGLSLLTGDVKAWVADTIKELIKRNVLVLTTGCATIACGKQGLNNPAVALEFAG